MNKPNLNLSLEKYYWLYYFGFASLTLIWYIMIVGLRIDHIIFLAFIAFMVFASKLTRRFAFAFTFFIIFWVCYDSLRVVPNHTINPVLTAEIYDLEKIIFGIHTELGVLTANEFFGLHEHIVFDLISGFYYLMWVPFPLLISIFLFYKDKINEILQFTFAFLLTNYIGFIFYYLYPAAPPWYFEIYGTEIRFDTLGSAARLLNFDYHTGTSIFKDMYTKGSNVFAAIPSLHSAYPVIATFYAYKFKLLYLFIFGVSVCLGIWFGAVYSNHHYIIDVLLGILCAVASIIFIEKILYKTRIKDWLHICAKKINNIR